MKVLNLYAGIGGNRKLWTDCSVTAVEINPDIAGVYESLYPDDEVIVGDAHQYLLENFHKYDFIWSSPPCQSHTRLMPTLIAESKKWRRYPDMSLYQEICFLKHFFEGLWLVENVIPYYQPLIKPSESYHRHFFWSNFGFHVGKIPCKKEFIFMGVKELEEWAGVSLEKKDFSSDKKKNTLLRRQILRNCVHPLIGKQIFETAKRLWKRRKERGEKGILTLTPRGFGL